MASEAINAQASLWVPEPCLAQSSVRLQAAEKARPLALSPSSDQELESRRDGVGGNKRTGQFVGTGAVLGAIIGAIAGGGKGAAIGAVAGAGAGAGAQII